MIDEQVSTSWALLWPPTTVSVAVAVAGSALITTVRVAVDCAKTPLTEPVTANFLAVCQDVFLCSVQCTSSC
jgi:hypothetical protein